MAKATKQKSGKWRCVASYTDENGAYKQKVFTAPSKKEAEFLASQSKEELCILVPSLYTSRTLPIRGICALVHIYFACKGLLVLLSLQRK